MKEPVSFIVFEDTVIRLERTIKRLWILCIIIFIACVVSNACWIYYESQYMDAETIEVRQMNDNGYNNYIGNDGDIINGYADD